MLKEWSALVVLQVFSVLPRQDGARANVVPGIESETLLTPNCAAALQAVCKDSEGCVIPD